jgi:hypothetical protein
MSGVFLNIDPSPPSPPGECVSPAFGAGGGHTRWVEKGWGVNSSEDARHLCMYSIYVSTLWCIHMFRLCLLHPLFNSFRRHAAPSIETVTKAAPKHFNDRVRQAKKSLQ